MGARKLWIIMGIAAAGAIAAIVISHGSGSHPANPDRRTVGPSPTGSGSGTASATTREPVRSIPGPRLTPAVPDAGAGAAPVPDAFDDEPRDAAWAADTEAELGPRLAIATDGDLATLVSAECRTHHCRITLDAKDDAALGVLMDRLATPEVLYQFADQMLVHAPEDVGGRRRLVVDAQFER